MSYGATGVVHRNTVAGNWYTGAGWTSTGILIFESDNVSVQGNTVSESQVGISVETWSWFTPSASNNKIVNNRITGADWGVSVAAYAWRYSAGDPVADNNKVVNNVITTGDGEAGVYIGAWWDGSAGYTPRADNNKAISNKIKGYETAVDNDGTRTKAHANATD